MTKTPYHWSDTLTVPALACNVTFDWASTLHVPSSYLRYRFIEIIHKIEINLEKETSCLTSIWTSDLSLERRASITTWDSLRMFDVKGKIWGLVDYSTLFQPTATCIQLNLCISKSTQNEFTQGTRLIPTAALSLSVLLWHKRVKSQTHLAFIKKKRRKSCFSGCKLPLK